MPGAFSLRRIVSDCVLLWLARRRRRLSNWLARARLVRCARKRGARPRRRRDKQISGSCFEPLDAKRQQKFALKARRNCAGGSLSHQLACRIAELDCAERPAGLDGHTFAPLRAAESIYSASSHLHLPRAFKLALAAAGAQLIFPNFTLNQRTRQTVPPRVGAHTRPPNHSYTYANSHLGDETRVAACNRQPAANSFAAPLTHSSDGDDDGEQCTPRVEHEEVRTTKTHVCRSVWRRL